MLVKKGERIYLEARVKAEAADNVLTSDYYTQLPQIRHQGRKSSDGETDRLLDRLALVEFSLASGRAQNHLSRSI